jgi:hypothetical protein
MITRYEIIAKHEQTGKIWLIGYTPRRSRPGMIDAMRNVGDEMIARLPIGEKDVMTWTKAGRDARCQIGPWRIFYSGKTQIDCRGCEHPFIAAKTA